MNVAPMASKSYKDTAPHIGKRPRVDTAVLQYAMRKHKFSLRSLAESAGLSYQAVWYVVRGTGRAKPENLQKICSSLGLSVADVCRPDQRPEIRIDLSRLIRSIGDRGFSSYRLAEEAQLPQSAVRNLLDGREPKATALKRVCDVLEIPIESVFIDGAASA